MEIIPDGPIVGSVGSWNLASVNGRLGARRSRSWLEPLMASFRC